MITNKEPITQKRKLRSWIEVLVLLCFLVIEGEGWDVVVFVLPVFGFFIGFTEFVEKQFDGWRIDNNSITLIRISLFGTKEEQTLIFKSIESILYVKPASKRPFSFEFKSKNKTYWLMPSMDIYGFSETLKFLKGQGIKIDFLEKDHEVELYLDGKIESIPMTNDMEIKNNFLA